MPPSVYLKMKGKNTPKVVSSRQLAGVAFVALFIFVRVFAQHLCSAHPNRCSGLCAVKLEKLKKKKLQYSCPHPEHQNFTSTEVSENYSLK